MVGKRNNQAEEKEDSKYGTRQVDVKSNQNGLYCEWCEKWFHCGCEKVGTAEYKLLNECRLRWFCRQCNGSIPGLRKEQMRLKEENNKLRLENESLRDRLNQFGKQDRKF